MKTQRLPLAKQLNYENENMYKKLNHINVKLMLLTAIEYMWIAIQRVQFSNREEKQDLSSHHINLLKTRVKEPLGQEKPNMWAKQMDGSCHFFILLLYLIYNAVVSCAVFFYHILICVLYPNHSLKEEKGHSQRKHHYRFILIRKT